VEVSGEFHIPPAFLTWICSMLHIKAETWVCTRVSVDAVEKRKFLLLGHSHSTELFHSLNIQHLPYLAPKFCPAM
jgi:hypothetical protein